MTKCSICKEKIETTFLNKLIGTYIKGKPVCSQCQRKELNTKKQTSTK